MPSGKRIKAPANIGTEIMKPFCAAFRLKVSLMKGAMAPFSTQMAKQKSKYKKAASSVGQWPDFKNVLKSPAMGCSAKKKKHWEFEPDRKPCFAWMHRGTGQ